MSGTYAYGDCTGSYEVSVEVEFDEKDGSEMIGDWTMKTSYEVACDGYDPYSYSYTESYEVVAEKVERKKYEISMNGESIDCEMDGDELTCDDGEGAEFTLEKAD